MPAHGSPASVQRRHVTKQQFVYETLRDAILRCEFQPGERLNIGGLAKRLGVSIVPIREALRLLESEGFIVNARALRLRPDLVEARYGLSSAAAALGDYDGAITLLRQVVAGLPQAAEPKYNLGIHYWNRYTALRQNAFCNARMHSIRAADRAFRTGTAPPTGSLATAAAYW